VPGSPFLQKDDECYASGDKEEKFPYFRVGLSGAARRNAPNCDGKEDNG